MKIVLFGTSFRLTLMFCQIAQNLLVLRFPLITIVKRISPMLFPACYDLDLTLENLSHR